VFKIQNTLAIFGGLALLYRHNRKFVDAAPTAQWQFAALFAAASLVYQPFWTIYRMGGQSTPTVFLLLVLALICHVKSRFLLSATCLIAAVLIKPAFAFALALLVCVSGWRFFRHTAMILALVSLASILILGWGVHEEFMRVMARGVQRSDPWLFNNSLYVTAENMNLLRNLSDNAIRWGLLLRLLALLTKPLVLAICAYLVVKSRALKLLEAAR